MPQCYLSRTRHAAVLYARLVILMHAREAQTRMKLIVTLLTLSRYGGYLGKMGHQCALIRHPNDGICIYHTMLAQKALRFGIRWMSRNCFYCSYSARTKFTCSVITCLLHTWTLNVKRVLNRQRVTLFQKTTFFFHSWLFGLNIAEISFKRSV